MWRPQHSLLRVLYRMGSHNRPSRAVGHLADARLPAPVLRRIMTAYIRAWKVPMDEVEVPPGGFRSLDEFFTRRLKADARPIASLPVVSPCDGRVVAEGRVEGGTLIQAKGLHYSLAELIGEDALAVRLEGGRYVTIYLSPRDYHRVHVPMDGEVLGWRHLPGVLFTVSPGATRRIQDLLVRNERLALLLRGALGREAAMVLVGAANVGRITSAFCGATTNRGRNCGEGRCEPPLSVRRGQEAGAFHLGSTVVLVLGRSPSLRPLVRVGDAVRMGQGLYEDGPSEP